jgi:uncharacterized protein YkwD
MRFGFVATVIVATVSGASSFVRAEAATGWSWPATTHSPHRQPSRDVGDDVAPLLARCGVPDAALSQVARALVARKLATGEGPAQEEVEAELRAAGEPHVWPKAWVVSGPALGDAAVLPKLAAWRAAFRTKGVVRCGAARHHTADTADVVAVVAVDALADLDPLPVRVHTGDWLEVSAHLDVEARGATVMVAPPDGPPLRVPSSFDGSQVHARFPASKPGAFSVQVLAETADGPRPVLEARVFADVEPPPGPDSAPAPGESAARGAASPTEAFVQMIAALRTEESLPALRRDAALDALAASHTRAMIAAHRVAHDLGDGDPEDRARAAGIEAATLGENVAHASTAELAHRALYESPSHRANLVKRSFRELGIAALPGPDGSIWVTELFAAPP